MSNVGIKKFDCITLIWKNKKRFSYLPTLFFFKGSPETQIFFFWPKQVYGDVLRLKVWSLSSNGISDIFSYRETNK